MKFFCLGDLALGLNRFKVLKFNSSVVSRS
jgi:hypothetical protein